MARPLGRCACTWVAAVSCALGLAAAARPARADDNYILRGDIFGEAEPGTALIVLSGEGQHDRFISAEALVWGGLRDSNATGDVLTLTVRLTDPGGRASLRVGRFVEVLGAMRPVQLDGGSVWTRLPGELRLEVYGGMPVVPRFEQRDWDWVVGTRLSRAVGNWGSFGFSYMQERDGGALATEEVGADAGIDITRWLAFNGKAAWDLVDPGLAEARAALSANGRTGYVELFDTYRSPARLLPATSLFSVLGDTPSELAGVSGRYRLFPRLSVEGTAGARVIGDFWGPSLRLATALWLDPTGQSAVTLEGRRESAPDDSNWTGVRVALRVAIISGLSAIGEAELVVPDHPGQEGDVWPWGLAGLTWHPTPRWEIAGAVQGEASPQYTSVLDALVRVTYLWKGPEE